MPREGKEEGGVFWEGKARDRPVSDSQCGSHGDALVRSPFGRTHGGECGWLTAPSCARSPGLLQPITEHVGVIEPGDAVLL